MSYRVERLPAAAQQLLAHVDYISDDDPDAALRFIDAVEAALAVLAEQPEIGARFESDNSELAGLRRWVLPRHPNYLLFYAVREDVVELVAVIHAATDH